MEMDSNITLYIGTLQIGECKPLSQQSYAKKTAKLLGVVTIFIFGVVINSIVIHLVRKTKALHKHMCYLIVNMAVGDMILLSLGTYKWLSILFSSSWLIGGIMGTVTCKLYTLLRLVVPIVSITTLLAISVERMRVVTSSMKVTHIKKTWFCMLIVLSWLIPAALFSYTLYAFDIVPYQGKLFCTDLYMDKKGWVLYHYAFYALMIVIFVVLVTLNIIIIKILHKSQRLINLPQCQKKKRAMKFLRAVRLITCCSLVFVACWGPRSCFKFLDHLSVMKFDYCSSLTLYFVIEVLYYIHVPLFPVLYLLILPNFRKEFIKLISCKKLHQNPSK